jgi:hypothetical protein
MKTILRCFNNKNHVSKIAGCLLLIAVLVFPLAITGCEDTGADFTINLLGTSHVFQLDSKDRLKSRVEISSEDGNVTLTIEKGTKFTDSTGNPVYAVQVEDEPYLPLPWNTTKIMSQDYKFSPLGATCSIPFTLTISYDPAELPAELTEGNVYVASYTVSTCTSCSRSPYIWFEAAENRANQETHRASGQIDTLDYYILLAAPEGMMLPKPE